MGACHKPFSSSSEENSVADPKHAQALSTHPSAGVRGPATPGVACELPSNRAFELLGRVSSGDGDLRARLQCE